MAWAADIDLEFAAYHRRGQNFAHGLMVGGLRSGDILRTDELHQEGTGQYFNANQFFVGGSLARAMTDRFSIGLTMKYFQENLDQYQTRALLADMGILYYVGLGDLRIGFAVRNFGSDVHPGGTPPPAPDGYVPAQEFQSFPAPTVGAFGAARTWDLSPKLALLTTADFSHPSDYSESFRFGGELALRQQLFLRAGFETNRAEGGLAAGFGLQVERRQMRIRIDYAYGDMGSFGVVHHFSVDVSPLWRRPADGSIPEAWPMTRRHAWQAAVAAAMVAGSGRRVRGCGEKIAIPQPQGLFSLTPYVVEDTYEAAGVRQIAEANGFVFARATPSSR